MMDLPFMQVGCPCPQSGSFRPPDGYEDDGWQALQTRRSWQLLGRVILGVTMLWAAAWLVSRAHQPTRSEIDAALSAQPRRPKPFAAIGPTDPQLLATIDMDRVHRELLPAWIIAMQHNPYTVGREGAEQAFAALQQEAGKDPNLRQLLSDLFDRVMDDPGAQAGDVAELLKGWNQYMQSHGLPWRVEHFIERSARGSRLFLMTYRVLADLGVWVAGQPQRAVLVSREDHSNLVEGFFGQTLASEPGALIVADRIAEFAVAQVWPLFDSEGNRRASALQHAFGPHIRQEAIHALATDMIQTLSDTAAEHRRLTDMLREVGTRRSCGSKVVIEQVPWDGLGDRARGALERAAARNEHRPAARKRKHACPHLTSAEVTAILSSSGRLSTDPLLHEGLQRLSAWLAQAVTVHEVRHLADDRDASDGERTPPCPLCPAHLTVDERAEVSAYLAAFGTPGLGYLSALQACGAGPMGRQPSAAALAFALQEVLPDGCEGQVPDNLYERAVASERKLFGRSDFITLPAEFPDTLPLNRNGGSNGTPP
jgi:hypothetical protein